MEYEQLGQEYRDDHLAEAMYAREQEWFHYDFDRINFERMLTVLPDGPYKQDIAQRLTDTRSRLQAVDLVYAALKSQIVDAGAHQRAVERAKAKREAKK